MGIPLDAKVFIYAGNYIKLKNVLLMLDYFNKNLSDNEYLISLGTGKLFEKAKKYNSSHIIQLGFKDNIMDYMDASDIYVSFSSSEGFPVSVIEALHSNLALLLSDIDSHLEFFKIDSEYYIGESFNLNSFSSIKKDVIKNLYKVNSYNFQKKYLSGKSMMDKYEKNYEELL